VCIIFELCQAMAHTLFMNQNLEQLIKNFVYMSQLCTTAM
jgi:hypothetical protein